MFHSGCVKLYTTCLNILHSGLTVLSILQKRNLNLNQFSIKRGSLLNLRGLKGTLSGPHIRVPFFPLSNSPRVPSAPFKITEIASPLQNPRVLPVIFCIFTTPWIASYPVACPGGGFGAEAPRKFWKFLSNQPILWPFLPLNPLQPPQILSSPPPTLQKTIRACGWYPRWSDMIVMIYQQLHYSAVNFMEWRSIKAEIIIIIIIIAWCSFQNH